MGQAGEAADPQDVEADAPEEVAKSGADLVESLNELAEAVRRGEVDEELLSEATEAAREARSKHAEAFDRDATEGETLAAKPDEGEADGAEAAAEDEHVEDIHEADGVAGGSGEVKDGDSSPDEVRRLVESGEVDMSPEYKRLAERYFSVLSEQESE